MSHSWRYIHTHFGIGYRFAAESAAAGEPVVEPLTAEPVAPDAPPVPVSA